MKKHKSIEKFAGLLNGGSQEACTQNCTNQAGFISQNAAFPVTDKKCNMSKNDGKNEAKSPKKSLGVTESQKLGDGGRNRTRNCPDCPFLRLTPSSYTQKCTQFSGSKSHEESSLDIPENLSTIIKSWNSLSKEIQDSIFSIVKLAVKGGGKNE